MSKILGKAKSVGKNYYFYAALYCIGMIGVLIITYFRYEVLAEALNLDNWKEIMYLLGTLLALPILALMFLKKISKSLSIFGGGIMSIIVMIAYWISTAGAETFVTTLRDILAPFLAVFFISSAITSMISVWQKDKLK